MSMNFSPDPVQVKKSDISVPDISRNAATKKTSENIDFSKPHSTQPKENYPGLGIERNANNTETNPQESHVCPADIEKMREEHGNLNSNNLDRYNREAYDPYVEEPQPKTDNTQPTAKALAKKKEVREICDDMFKAIDGFGTDDKLFEKTLSRLNKDNIIEVMEHWDKSYGNDYEETFFTSFVRDADTKQKQELGIKMIQLLEERADALGLDFTDTTTAIKKVLNRESSHFWGVGVSYSRADIMIRDMMHQIKAKE